MRKITTLLLGLLVAAIAFGKSVTMEQANQVANNYLSATSLKTSRSVANSFSKSYNGITTYYVFNYTGGGFIVVSADDAARPILAQSDEGFIETEITNPEARYWFDSYSKQIANIVDSKADNTKSRAEWDNILNNRIKSPTADVVVGPLLTTTWDQGAYYNFYCPTAAGGPGGKAYAGCVATTMGQIMKYHNFPTTGVGSHSYLHSTYGLKSVNFGATTYNFANMGNTASYSKYKDIATLLYHAGVSVDMNYAADGSGAFSENVPYALSTYFNYDNASIGLANISDYLVNEWEALIMSELDASRPVYYSGNDLEVGHAWVCDGYQTTSGVTQFHMNWGWSGSANGYFTIGSLDANGYMPNLDNSIIYGIKPGKSDLIVRFTNLDENNSTLLGTTLDINCSVVKGSPTDVNLYIDNNLVLNTTQSIFSYPWNTNSADLNTVHVFRVEAISATDTVFQEVNMTLSEWKDQSTGFATAYRGISYIHAVDESNIWATAFDGSGGGATLNEFTKTTNGGDTWITGQVLGGSVYGLGNICGLNANVAYVSVFHKTTQDNTCGVYKTSNGGNTWTHLTGALQGSASFADNVWFWNENEGMCHGDVKDNYFEIYTTSNGGSTWTRVPKANIGGGVNAETGEGGWTSVIQAVGASTIMFGTNKGNLYISHDKGLNWTISNTGITPITEGVNLISFKDNLNGLVAQTNTTLVLKETHDGGLSWTTVNPTGSFHTNDLVYVPGTENTFVSTGSGISYSFDGGHSWSNAGGTQYNYYPSVAFVNNHSGWAGGYNVSSSEKGIYKYMGILEPNTVLNPISNLTATPGINSVQLSWTEPVTVPLSYNIYCNDVLLTNTTSLQYTDLPLVGGTLNYCVAAVYALGESAQTCATAEVVLGLANTDQAAFRIYPNPSSDIINVVAPAKFNEVRLVNSLGKVVYKNNTKGSNLRILTAGIQPGVYVLQIYTGTQVISKKVSITR